MQLFSEDAIVFSKKINNFFDPENMKKRPQKLLIIGPQLLFLYWPGYPNGPEMEIPYHQKPLNADWVFRWGLNI